MSCPLMSTYYVIYCVLAKQKTLLKSLHSNFTVNKLLYSLKLTGGLI